MRRGVLVLSLVLLLLAQISAQSANERRAADFVRSFYEWYVPLALDEKEATPAWIIAINRRSDLFEKELAEALGEDRAAQENVTGEIVGLDFDPFLFTQDPCDRFDLGKVKAVERAIRVEVIHVCHGVRAGNAAVIAELVERNGAWVFRNFYSPDGWDLRQMLKVSKDAREVRE